MERERRIHYRLLINLVGLACTLASCSHLTFADANCIYDEKIPVKVRLIPEGFMTKAYNPDEDLISDINILVFNEDGQAEACLWETDNYRRRESVVNLYEGQRYSFYACANIGRRIEVRNINDIHDITFHLSYPDELRAGIPMVACKTDVLITKETSIEMVFERLMAKVSLRMDRSSLNEDVDMRVLSARIGNCPRQSKVFTVNSLTEASQSFSLGFMRDEAECAVLNVSDKNGKSGTLSLYMLENMQGRFSGNDVEHCEKVFGENDPRRHTCSYIEMELSYISNKIYSLDEGLIYRFYLGEDASSLDVERNCHYRVTIAPEGDGLSDGGWRVDKTSLFPAGDTFIKAYPASYIRGDIGDRIHIWCDVFPPNAGFDVGVEYMEADKERGIYDYEVDPGSHGAILTLTGPGTGLIYMEAGPPVNDAALFIIEVNLPDVI